MFNQQPITTYETEISNFQETFISAINGTQTHHPLRGATFTTYNAGQTIIHMMGLGKRGYVVTSGEAAIYVNGLPVDLLEAGEYFDESIWLGGEVIALTDCTLRTVSEPARHPIQH